MKSPLKLNNERLSFLMKFAGHMIDSLIDGLEQVDTETRKRIMQQFFFGAVEDRE
jgi:hypothetical protein